jgi:exodeoxyribonuclease VII large subunit
MRPAMERFTHRAAERLQSLEKLRQSLNPDGPLKRGFARIHHADGSLARAAAALEAGEAVRMVFLDGERQAVVDGELGARADPASLDPAPARRGKAAKPANPGQGDLF